MKRLTAKQAEKRLQKYCDERYNEPDREWGINIYNLESCTYSTVDANGRTLLITIDYNTGNIVEEHRKKGLL